MPAVTGSRERDRRLKRLTAWRHSRQAEQLAHDERALVEYLWQKQRLATDREIESLRRELQHTIAAYQSKVVA